MAVEEDVALQVQELERLQRDARELLELGQLRARPALGPVRAHEDDAAGRDRPVVDLPPADVGDLQRVVEVLADLGHDRDDDQRAHREGRRQLVDGRVLGRPVRRRVELRAELVGGQRVARGLEAVGLVGVRVAGGRVDRGCELRGAEARPHRDRRRDRVGQVDVARALERVSRRPSRATSPAADAPAAPSGGEHHGDGRGDEGPAHGVLQWVGAQDGAVPITRAPRDQHGAIEARHAHRRPRLPRRRSRQRRRARRRARLRRDPDLQPEPARVEADRLQRRAGRGLPRGDGRQPRRRAAHPRRLPAQRRHHRQGDARQDARVAHRLAAAPATPSARTPSSCTPAARWPARSRPAIKRAGKVIARGAGRERALRAAPREHRRHGRDARALVPGARRPHRRRRRLASAWACAWTPATCSPRATTSAPRRASRQVLDECDAAVGLERLGSLHLNDSQTPLGSNRDRHADVGEGELGRARLRGLPLRAALRRTAVRAGDAGTRRPRPDEGADHPDASSARPGQRSGAVRPAGCCGYTRVRGPPPPVHRRAVVHHRAQAEKATPRPRSSGRARGRSRERSGRSALACDAMSRICIGKRPVLDAFSRRRATRTATGLAHRLGPIG